MLELSIAWRERLQVESGLTRAALAMEADIDTCRVTHVLNLLNLTPDIRRRVLVLPESGGRSPLSERRLRRIARIRDQRLQSAAIQGLMAPRRARAGN